MRLSTILGNAAVLLFLALPCAARAADEPEAVYAKYHRAAMAGDLQEMLKYWPAARRAEMQGASESSKEAALKMAQYMSPRAFKLERKTVAPNGRKAMLIVSGPWEAGRRNMDTIYGTVNLVSENGEWKVDDSSWSLDKPAALATPAPAAPAAAKAHAPGTGAPVIGTMSAAPVHKLGVAKEPCVYKPVMTNEDMERCR
jgi:hypothetical protein